MEQIWSIKKVHFNLIVNLKFDNGNLFRSNCNWIFRHESWIRIWVIMFNIQIYTQNVTIKNNLKNVVTISVPENWGYDF